MTNSQLIEALKLAQPYGGERFTNIGDISCDPAGGLEFMTHATTLSSPSFVLQPSPELPPVRIMSVDILPTAVPSDASEVFSNALMPYLQSIIASYAGEPAGEFEEAIERATIAKDGHLTEKHAWLGELAAPHNEKHVLILGSGMVAGPAVDKIARRGDVKVTVGTCLRSMSVRDVHKECSE